MLKIPTEASQIIERLESAGFEAFVVGGCVRDVIRGATPKDWDIATSATPSQVKALFSRTVDTGLKHGTVTVIVNREGFEVTTYRVDGEYLDNRRPSEVTFARKIEEDLSRRDFTINAIAYSPTRGFVDPFGGREDIERRVIKCVGEPIARFGEDALRMLRAIRFSAVLGFEVDGAILQAISVLGRNLANISAERIREELCKLIGGENPAALGLLQATGLMVHALRGREFGGDLAKIISYLAASRASLDEPMRLAIFFAWAGENSAEILRDLRFDNKTIKIASIYIEFLPQVIPQTRVEIKKALRILGAEIFDKLLTLKKITRAESVDSTRAEARDILAKNEPFTLRHLSVNGDDLTAEGFPSGKTIGETLERLLQAVIADPSANTKEVLLCRAKQTK